jgi:hypothetical protein
MNIQDSNPVCLTGEYIDEILKILPGLNILDCGHLDVFEAFDAIQGGFILFEI